MKKPLCGARPMAPKLRSTATDRGSLQFKDMVGTNFRFLCSDYGFTVVKAETTFVRYESEMLFVNVYHGRRSYEIGLEVGQLSEPASNRFRFEYIVGGLRGRTHGLQTFFQASTRDGVRLSVEELATTLREHGGALLRGEAEAFAKVRSFAAQLNSEITKEIVQRPLRRNAE